MKMFKRWVVSVLLVLSLSVEMCSGVYALDSSEGTAGEEQGQTTEKTDDTGSGSNTDKTDESEDETGAASDEEGESSDDESGKLEQTISVENADLSLTLGDEICLADLAIETDGDGALSFAVCYSETEEEFKEEDGIVRIRKELTEEESDPGSDETNVSNETNVSDDSDTKDDESEEPRYPFIYSGDLEDLYLVAQHAGQIDVAVMAAETEDYQAAETFLHITVNKKTQKVTKKDLSIVYGKTGQIVASASGDGALSYVSTNASIVSVDESGLVKGLKKGKTTVKVVAAETETYQAASATVTVTVTTSLNAPVVKFTNYVGGTMSISWSKVSGADGYYVYHKLGNGTRERCATIKQTSAKTYKYTEKNITKATTDYFCVYAYKDNGKDISAKSNVLSARWLDAPSMSVVKTAKGPLLSWNGIKGANKYVIYRKKTTAKSWTRVAVITNLSTQKWKDTSAGNSCTYQYCMRAAYTADSTSYSKKSAVVSCYALTAPIINSCTKSGSSLTVKWSANSSATGYQLQYATNRFFSGAKTVNIPTKATVTKTITGLSEDKTYYVRVRSYKKSGSNIYYSGWRTSSNVTATKLATTKQLKKDDETFDVRAAAKQVVGGYDTLQGGTTDGTYAYYVFLNKTVSEKNCKIVKIRLKDLKVVKVSAAMTLTHGNDMTYNSKTKKLYIVHTKSGYISRVDAATLKFEKTFKLTIPSKLRGASPSQISAIKNYCGISYNKKRNQYALYLCDSGDVLICNSSFKPVQYLYLDTKGPQTKQGMDTTDSYILLCQSSDVSSQYNIIQVYTWDGELSSRINVKKGEELENLYHIGRQFYASFYNAFYETYETKENGKTVTKKRFTKTATVYKIGDF